LLVIHPLQSSRWPEKVSKKCRQLDMQVVAIELYYGIQQLITESTASLSCVEIFATFVGSYK